MHKEKKKTNLLLNKKKHFLLLNEDIELLLKFKKYLSTYMLQSKLRKDSVPTAAKYN